MYFQKKEVALLWDYNINLLNCDSDKNTCDFPELMLSFSFLPRIIKPTWISLRSQTLIDNIFINEIHSNIAAGNITTDISDHLIQFAAIPGDWHTEISSQDIYRRNYKNPNSVRFNPLQPSVPSVAYLYPLKTSENPRVFRCFQGVYISNTGQSWVKEDFNKINWTNLFSDKNVDDAYDSFLDETEKIINKHISLKKVSKLKLK